MVGLDQFITKNATLTNEKADDAFPIKAMKFSVSPVVSYLLMLLSCSPAIYVFFINRVTGCATCMRSVKAVCQPANFITSGRVASVSAN